MRTHHSKVCPVCGQKFQALYARQECCSRKCAAIKRYGPPKPKKRKPGKPHHHCGAFGETAVEKAEMKARDAAAEARRARLEARDRLYAASPYAARVTVETRGGVVVETRGMTCSGRVWP